MNTPPPLRETKDLKYTAGCLTLIFANFLAWVLLAWLVKWIFFT